jgi:acetyl-CoA carboxylase biotin carboxyl carrier protein
MDLKDIKAIIDLMRKNNLSEFEMERQDFKIKLKRAAGVAPAVEEPGYYPVAPAAPAPLPMSAPSAPAAAATAAAAAGPPSLEIESPMIGTFYRAPSPESQPYVEVGSEVNPETIVCLIEAMKVMNEIKAEVKGVVTHILADNAKPVEFGQPLFRIRPA